MQVSTEIGKYTLDWIALATYELHCLSAYVCSALKLVMALLND